jgi:hypothetical protein
LNGTALVTALLLVRLASLVVPGTDEAKFARYVGHLAYVIVWPFRQVPVLDRLIGREVYVADLILIPLVFIAGLLAAGVLTGWEEASSPPPYNDPSSA